MRKYGITRFHVIVVGVLLLEAFSGCPRNNSYGSVFCLKINHPQNFRNRARYRNKELLKRLVRSYSPKLTAKTLNARRHLQIS